MYFEGLALFNELSRLVVNVDHLLAQLFSQPRGVIIVPHNRTLKWGRLNSEWLLTGRDLPT